MNFSWEEAMLAAKDGALSLWRQHAAQCVLDMG